MKAKEVKKEVRVGATEGHRLQWDHFEDATCRAGEINCIAISPALMNFVAKLEVLDSILSDPSAYWLLQMLMRSQNQF